MQVTIRNRAPEEATLHVLPTIWFRNEWSWNPDGGKPSLTAGPGGGTVLASHAELGDYVLEMGPAPDGSAATLLFCENETNLARIDGSPSVTPYPKDGINDHVVDGAATVNPAGTGTKAAAWYQLTVPAGGSAELRLRLSKVARPPRPPRPQRPPRAPPTRSGQIRWAATSARRCVSARPRPTSSTRRCGARVAPTTSS